MKSNIKHAGTWSTATWPPRRLCYRPAVSPATFVYCDFIPATNIRLFKNVAISIVYFLWNFVFLMLPNLKFRKPGSVCSWDLKPTVTEGLQETSRPYSTPWVAFYHISGTCGLQFGGPFATYFPRTNETEFGRLCYANDIPKKCWQVVEYRFYTARTTRGRHIKLRWCPRHLLGRSFILPYLAYLRKRAQMAGARLLWRLDNFTWRLEFKKRVS
jgi:hypothetical protein